MTFWTALYFGLFWLVAQDAVADVVHVVTTFLALWGAATALDMVARRDG